MSLTYPTFDQIDATRLAALRELLNSVLVSYNPSLDLRRGVVGDLVLQARALLAATTEQGVLNELNATSLSVINANPAIADQTAVDRVVGNFGLTRRAAIAASGSVAIVLNRLADTIIAAGSVFTVGTQVFTADQTYTGRANSGDVILPTDRLITAVTGGNYVFVISVVAKVAGAASNSNRGASAVPSTSPFGFVRAYADADLSGGADAESNASLLSRQASGLAAKSWSNRPSIEAAIRNQSEFSALQNISVVGYGDPEMLRDQHSIWPVSGGSRADLYARTDVLYQTIRLRKTATLVSKIGSLGTWQFGMARSDAPGFYEISSVTLPSGDPTVTSFSITQDVRSIDMTGSGLPDVKTPTEGVYSSYQAGTFQFADTITNATSLIVNTAQASYDVLVRVMKNISDLQSFWLDANNAPTSGDVLVKAPVPCFVTMSMTLNVPTGTTVSTALIASQLATAINQLNFPGTLASSYVSKVMHSLIPSLNSITSYVVSGRIRAPGGSTISLSGSSDLVIPNSPSLMVTSNTTTFFISGSDITLTVVSS